MAVTLDDFGKKKVGYTVEVDFVKFVKPEPELVKAEKSVALTEKGKRVLKKLFIEGKIDMSKKPWWDEI